MTERLPEPLPPQTMHEPADPEAELSRRNMIYGLAIFGFVLGFVARLPEPTPGPSFRFLRRK